MTFCLHLVCVISTLLFTAVADPQTASNYSTVVKYGATIDGILSNIAAGKFKGIPLESQIQWMKSTIDIETCACVKMDTQCDFSVPLTVLKKFGVECPTQFCCKHKKIVGLDNTGKASESNPAKKPIRNKTIKCTCELQTTCPQKYTGSSHKALCPVDMVQCCQQIVNYKSNAEKLLAEESEGIVLVMPETKYETEVMERENQERKENSFVVQEDTSTESAVETTTNKICHCVARNQCQDVDETVINKKGYECPFNYIQCCQKNGLELKTLMMQRKTLLPIWIPQPLIPSHFERATERILTERQSSAATVKSSIRNLKRTSPVTSTSTEASKRTDVTPLIFPTFSGFDLEPESREQTPEYRLPPFIWPGVTIPNQPRRGQFQNAYNISQQENIFQRLVKLFG